jgi:hypothetical protein
LSSIEKLYFQAFHSSTCLIEYYQIDPSFDFYKCRRIHSFAAVPHLKISQHSEREWISKEYKNWSKTYADQNDRTDDMIIDYVRSSFRVCKSNERLLNICKFVSYFLYFGSTLELIFIRKSEEDFKILLKKLENVAK